jgi:hypothetical protein
MTPLAAACRYAFEILLEVKRILEGLPTLVDVPVRPFPPVARCAHGRSGSTPS